MNFGMFLIVLFLPESFRIFTFESNWLDVTMALAWGLITLYCVASALFLSPFHARLAIFLSTVPLLFLLGMVVGETVVRVVDYGAHSMRPSFALMWYIPIGTAIIVQRWMALRFSKFAAMDRAKDRDRCG